MESCELTLKPETVATRKQHDPVIAELIQELVNVIEITVTIRNSVGDMREECEEHVISNYQEVQTDEIPNSDELDFIHLSPALQGLTQAYVHSHASEVESNQESQTQPSNPVCFDDPHRILPALEAKSGNDAIENSEMQVESTNDGSTEDGRLDELGIVQGLVQPAHDSYDKPVKSEESVEVIPESQNESDEPMEECTNDLEEKVIKLADCKGLENVDLPNGSENLSPSRENQTDLASSTYDIPLAQEEFQQKRSGQLDGHPENDQSRTQDLVTLTHNSDNQVIQNLGSVQVDVAVKFQQSQEDSEASDYSSQCIEEEEFGDSSVQELQLDGSSVQEIEMEDSKTTSKHQDQQKESDTANEVNRIQEEQVVSESYPVQVEVENLEELGPANRPEEECPCNESDQLKDETLNDSSFQSSQECSLSGNIAVQESVQSCGVAALTATTSDEELEIALQLCEEHMTEQSKKVSESTDSIQELHVQKMPSMNDFCGHSQDEDPENCGTVGQAAQQMDESAKSAPSAKPDEGTVVMEESLLSEETLAQGGIDEMIEELINFATGEPITCIPLRSNEGSGTAIPSSQPSQDYEEFQHLQQIEVPLPESQLDAKDQTQTGRQQLGPEECDEQEYEYHQVMNEDDTSEDHPPKEASIQDLVSEVKDTTKETRHKHDGDLMSETDREEHSFEDNTFESEVCDQLIQQLADVMPDPSAEGKPEAEFEMGCQSLRSVQDQVCLDHKASDDKLIEPGDNAEAESVQVPQDDQERDLRNLIQNSSGYQDSCLEGQSVPVANVSCDDNCEANGGSLAVAIQYGNNCNADVPINTSAPDQLDDALDLQCVPDTEVTNEFDGNHRPVEDTEEELTEISHVEEIIEQDPEEVDKDSTLEDGHSGCANTCNKSCLTNSSRMDDNEEDYSATWNKSTEIGRGDGDLEIQTETEIQTERDTEDLIVEINAPASSEEQEQSLTNDENLSVVVETLEHDPELENIRPHRESNEMKCVSFASPLTEYHEYQSLSQDDYASQSTLDITELLSADHVDENDLNAEVQLIFEGKLDVEGSQSRNISCNIIEEPIEESDFGQQCDLDEIQDEIQDEIKEKTRDSFGYFTDSPDLPIFGTQIFNPLLEYTDSPVPNFASHHFPNLMKSQERTESHEPKDMFKVTHNYMQYLDGDTGNSLYDCDAPLFSNLTKRRSSDDLTLAQDPKRTKSEDIQEHIKYIQSEVVDEDDHRGSQEVPDEEIIQDSESSEDQAVPSLEEDCGDLNTACLKGPSGGHGNFGSGSLSWQYPVNNFSGGDQLSNAGVNETPTLQPLQTCRKPIRTGLSKRQRVAHLHPYLKPKNS